MTATELRESQHPFLQGLSNEHLEKLAQFSLLTRFDKGELILKEGDQANRFYLILQGQVALEATTKSGAVVTVQRLLEGDVLGWSWLTEPEKWTFSARSVTACKCIFFYGTRLREACIEDAEFGIQILSRVSAVLADRLHTVRLLLLEQISETK